MEIKRYSGIYCIKNLKTKKIYIGQSVNLKSRKRKHFLELKNNNHFNIHLQNSYNKYGKKNFKFEILEYCEDKFLNKQEIYWIKYFDSTNSTTGYNVSMGGEGNVNPSIETRKKLSKALIGHYVSKKTREKISKANTGKTSPFKGKTHTKKAKEKIGESSKGRCVKEKNHWYRTHLTPEIRQKMSQNHANVSGENNPGSKLTEKQVSKILELYHMKYWGIKDIEQIFDVTSTTIRAVCSGKTWKHCYKIFMEGKDEI